MMAGSGSPTFVFDAENRIASSFNGTSTTSYTYNGDGERVKKSSGTLYWGPEPLAESDASGNITAEYIFLNGRRIARRDTSGAVHYYFEDHLGSTSVTTSASGAIENDSDFYPFGGERVVVTDSANHYKFTGKERDGESQNDYFGARYYASAIGRFMSPDWAARPTAVPYAVFGDPQSLNLYGYVRNDPVTNADPDGHDPGEHTAATAGGATSCRPSPDHGCSSEGTGDPDAKDQPENSPAVQNLVAAQDAAMANGKYAPNTPTTGTTHCSEAACSIAKHTGVDTTGVLSDAKGRNYPANTQINNLANPQNGFHTVTPQQAQT
ncbi:MAG: RHS repeat-associated core domain-containing protein, partial [Acidobacteria bacterium]|nr:RHS repeat-associated core domain-containing protein [Acidobacteriota bacterium]